MRRAVESVTADLLLLVVTVRDGIHIRMLRHSLVKRGIEHRDLRSLRSEQFLCCLNALKINGIVQRSQLNAVLDSLQYVVIDKRRVFESLASVHHPMPD